MRKIEMICAMCCDNPCRCNPDAKQLRNEARQRREAQTMLLRAVLEGADERRAKMDALWHVPSLEDDRLRKIEHLVWHLIDDNSDGDEGLAAVPKSDVWLAQLLPLLKKHPEYGKHPYPRDS